MPGLEFILLKNNWSQIPQEQPQVLQASWNSSSNLRSPPKACTPLILCVSFSLFLTFSWHVQNWVLQVGKSTGGQISNPCLLLVQRHKHPPKNTQGMILTCLEILSTTNKQTNSRTQQRR